MYYIDTLSSDMYHTLLLKISASQLLIISRTMIKLGPIIHWMTWYIHYDIWGKHCHKPCRLKDMPLCSFSFDLQQMFKTDNLKMFGLLQLYGMIFKIVQHCSLYVLSLRSMKIDLKVNWDRFPQVLCHY